MKTTILIICTLLIAACKETKTNDISTNENRIIELRSGEQFNFINPLLDCYDLKPSTIQSYKELESELKLYIKSSIAKKETEEISVYYRNLSSGEWIGIGEDEIYSPASLLKVPYMIAAFKYAENNSNYLSNKVTYFPIGERKVQSISSGFSLQEGKTYSIERYIQAMIIESDNDAKDIVVNSIPDANYVDIFAELGIDIRKYDTLNNATNFISVKEYANFFRILYNATYLNKEFSEYALNILSHTLFKDGIVSGLPNSIPIAHKFGERYQLGSDERQLHDCGIIYLPYNPYILCIMTKGTDFNKMKKSIADISELVYEHFIANNQ